MKFVQLGHNGGVSKLLIIHNCFIQAMLFSCFEMKCLCIDLLNNAFQRKENCSPLYLASHKQARKYVSTCKSWKVLLALLATMYLPHFGQCFLFCLAKVVATRFILILHDWPCLHQGASVYDNCLVSTGTNQTLETLRKWLHHGSFSTYWPS